MPYTVDFDTVSTVGLESSPHAERAKATPTAPTTIKLVLRLTRTASYYVRLRPLGGSTQFVARHNI